LVLECVDKRSSLAKSFEEEVRMRATSRYPVLGNVEVGGEMYQLAPVGKDGYEAIRLADSQRIGTVAGVAGWMWRLQSESPELMQAIMHEAMTSGLGLLQEPPD
jgi:hypothetical protein